MAFYDLDWKIENHNSLTVNWIYTDAYIPVQNSHFNLHCHWGGGDFPISPSLLALLEVNLRSQSE